MIHKNNAVPWFLIAELANKGKPINELADKFHVSPARIKKQLDKRLNSQTGRVRSNLEIKQASQAVRSDLVSVLEKLSQSLATKELSQKDIPALGKLIDSAAKLFSWPNAKPVDQSLLINAPNMTPAVNLALIRTSPEQLRANRPKLIDLNNQQDE